MSFFFVTIFCIVFFLCGGPLLLKKVIYVDGFYDYDFQVHVINVDKGDSILVKFPNNKIMLIDSGEEKYSDIVISYINQFMKVENINKIDYFVLSHPDFDHVGGATKIIESFDVINIFRPKIYSNYEYENIENLEDYAVSDTLSYDNAIDCGYRKGCNMIFTEKGITLNENGVKVEFLSPSLSYYNNSNNYSAVIMMTYQDKKFLFTGDAESLIEENLINDYGDYLKADVLKIAHHGSKTSSTQEFLNKVMPEYGLLCVGRDDSFPNIDVVNRFNDVGTKLIYTTSGNFAMSVKNNEIVLANEAKPSCDMALLASIFIILLLLLWAYKFKWLKSNFIKNKTVK